VSSNFGDLLKILDESEPGPTNNANVSKKLRLRLMKIMFQETTTLDMETLKKLLPEIILYTKEVNTNCRDTAFEVLSLLGDNCVKFGENNLKTLFNTVSAGLALEPRFISSTLSALVYLQKKFLSHLEKDYLLELLQTSILFLQSPNREVVHSALHFFRSSIGVHSAEKLKIVVPDLMKFVGEWNSGTKNKFHSDFKIILEKLLRKMGYEELLPHVPWTTLLQNVRKSLSRAQKKKSKKKKKE